MGFTRPIQSLGGQTSAQKQRSQALADYYSNPNHCLQCNAVIRVQDNEKVHYARAKKFCNASCAATYNNKLFRKRHRSNHCESCDDLITTGKKYCSTLCRQIAQKAARDRRKSQGLTSSTYVISWRQRTKLRAIQYKGGGCQICGYNKSIRALTFHHLDPGQKDFGISSKIRSWDTLKVELDKCVLLCANCHAEVHDGITILNNPSS